MKDKSEVVALKLDEIDLSKIPQHIYKSNKRYKVERVFLYISNIKKFMCIDLKHLKKKTKDFRVIMMRDDLNIFNTADNVYYYFYNIDEFSKDYPNSAIDTFAKQKNVYYDYHNADKYLMRYAWLYQQYPILEQLVKAGLCDVIYNLVYRNSPTYYSIDNIFNAYGKDICEITGLKKSHYQIARDNINKIDTYIEFTKFVKKHNVSAQQLYRLIDVLKNNDYYSMGGISNELSRCLYSINDLLEIEFENKKLYSFNTLMNYVEKQLAAQGFLQANNFLTHLYDYVKMCVEMNVKPDIKTKNLLREHNVTMIQYNQVKDELLDEKYTESFDSQYQKLKQYEYHDNRLEVIVPRRPKDIIEEGKNNHNCVGSYVSSHADGASNIFFVRKIDNADKSYITVELDSNLSKVRQAYYSYNKQLNNMDNGFINKWMHDVVLRRTDNE